MVSSRQVNFFITPLTWIAAILIFSITACTVPRKYQSGKPFIYRTAIKVEGGGLSKSQKQQLRSGLNNQLDDSLKVRTVLAVRILPPFFYNRLARPPVFDSLYIGRSKTFMSALLGAQGYFYPTIGSTYNIDTVRDQQRVTVRFTVDPGTALRLDSVGYDLQTPELQALALQHIRSSNLKKNEPYSVQKIASELDRLLGIYRDNGYYKIAREDLYAEHDTVVAALIDPTLDPFEQLELLDSLSKRKREPTINVVIKQRPPKDSTHLHKYHWATVNVYPDRSILEERPSVIDTIRIDGYNIFPSSHRFKLPFIARNIFVRPGGLYRQSDYFKTINRFTNLGAWGQVDLNVQEREPSPGDSLHLLDADLLLFPAKKQSMNIDFETSRNALDVLTAGSFFGIGLNLGVRNRNAFRESISTTTNLRFGVELGPGIVQTIQGSFGHNIFIPRIIFPGAHRLQEKLTAPRTIINVNGSYTNRREFFDLRAVNASWGYDASYRNHNFQFTLFNFEFNDVYRTTDSLERIKERYPTIAQAFTNVMIISQIFAYTTGNTRGRHISYFRAKLEQSGALTGLLFKNLERGDLRRFLKLDLEYKYFIDLPKSTWAFRGFGGYGYVYGKTGNQPENNLPFLKAYFGGGPYSMRAWAVRRLGLGSAVTYDTARTDRWGDFKLEGNIEYRFNLGTLFGIKLKSAFFTDFGNIWGKTLDKDLNRIDSAEFKLSRLYTDLAVGAGTSLRFDFDFFLIRLDWAYQIKNPVYAADNKGWFHNLRLKDGQFQLGIGYPF